MNTNTIQKHYPKLTARERFALIVQAEARDDNQDERALLDTAPKINWEFPHTQGLTMGFRQLTKHHIMQQLGAAGSFFMILSMSGDESHHERMATIDAEEIPTGETALELIARRFMEGLEGYKTVCQEYGIDPDILREYNQYPILTGLTETIIRRGYQLAPTELIDLESTTAAYRSVIETARIEWAEAKAQPVKDR